MRMFGPWIKYDGPQRENGGPFSIAATQMRQLQNAFGVATAPPEPRISISMSIRFIGLIATMRP
jgi:hypothetical protein